MWSEEPSMTKFCLIFKQVTKNINLLKVYGPRNQAWPRFCLIFKQLTKNINLPKVCGLRNQAWPRFCFIFKQVTKNINLPKIYGSRNQTRPKFCLIFKQVINTTHNENMVELPFINNSTFTDYLHSKVVVQHFCPDLLGSIHLCLLSRWYGMALPNWALTSLILGFL